MKYDERISALKAHFNDMKVNLLLLIFVLLKSQLFPSTKIGVSPPEIYLNIRKCTSLRFRTKLIAVITFFFPVSHTFSSELKCTLLSEISQRYPYYIIKSLFHILLNKAWRENFSGIIHNSEFYSSFLNVLKFFNITFEIHTHTRTKLALFYGPVRVT